MGRQAVSVMPLRPFKVTFKDGTTETIMADSLDEAWAKARRSARRQISVRQQGRKVVADVYRDHNAGIMQRPELRGREGD